MKKWIAGLWVLLALCFPLLAENDIQVTILYDNYVHTAGTQADWGFSCLIEGIEKTILFDTGTQPEIFQHNLDTLKVDLSAVDLVVISHEHGDHTGGLWSFLEKKQDVAVYVPVSFSQDFEKRVRASGSRTVRVTYPVEICRDVWLTGEVKGPVNEQAIFLDTSQGLVLITGCAHPGVVNMIESARKALNKDVTFVFGGFHLMDKAKQDIQNIITKFEEMGVRKCGATHCTGEQQIEWFKQAYGENYVGMGAGRIIRIAR
jgi:7,8-dihydropterin-6-yl-methyl-4-(beta-D-ribofuranosyl)aminobenzene 5'-phosphate synthase